MPGVGGVAVAPHAPPQPTLTMETELPDQDEYEVRIYDERHGRRLVAAIELISPSTSRMNECGVSGHNRLWHLPFGCYREDKTI